MLQRYMVVTVLAFLVLAARPARAQQSCLECEQQNQTCVTAANNQNSQCVNQAYANKRSCVEDAYWTWVNCIYAPMVVYREYCQVEFDWKMWNCEEVSTGEYRNCSETAYWTLDSCRQQNDGCMSSCQ